MARKFLTAIDLTKNEIQNAVAQNLPSAPSAPVSGQFYFNSEDDTLYWYNGAGWVAAKDAGATSVYNQTVRDDGTARAQRAALNFVSTASVAMSVTDDGANDETEISADVQFGSVVAETTYGQSSANGSASTVARSDHTHGTPPHGAAQHSGIPISALAAATADVSLGGFKITNLAAPTAAADAATKSYVDNAVAGLSWKDPVRIATTANIGLSGLAAIDGVTPVAGDRILVKDQSTASANGIYVAASGAWARATDADAVGELEGAAVYVTAGTTNGGKAYVVSTTGAITPGTTAVSWAQFGGGSAIVAGNGLTLTGNTLDIVSANAGIAVNADNIALNFTTAGGTNGSATTVARGDHNHDGTYTKKYSADCAAATSTTVTHNLNTRDVAVAVYATSSPYDEVSCDVEHATVNTVIVRFAVAPTAGQYRITVVG